MANTVKTPSLVVALLLALAARCAFAADAGIVSIVEGQARVLRGTTWYKLVPGMRFEEGDLVVAKGAGQIQVELATKGTFNLGTPGTLLAVDMPDAADKTANPVELWLPEGWLKLAAAAPAPGFKLQLPSAAVDASEAIVLLHVQPGAVEMFVESGDARVTDTGPAAGKSPPATDVKAGEYAAQSTERPLHFERRAPATFVTTIPRHLIDPLPSLAARYKSVKVPLVAEQEVTLAEAQPWLAGPYRKLFLKRLAPRLKDREFRAGVAANIARYPEWEHIVYPEKKKTTVPATAK